MNKLRLLLLMPFVVLSLNSSVASFAQLLFATPSLMPSVVTALPKVMMAGQVRRYSTATEEDGVSKEYVYKQLLNVQDELHKSRSKMMRLEQTMTYQDLESLSARYFAEYEIYSHVSWFNYVDILQSKMSYDELKKAHHILKLVQQWIDKWNREMDNACKKQ